MTNEEYRQTLALIGRAALRDLFRALAKGEFPPGAELYVTFLTGAAGVEIPDAARAQYPGHITVCLRERSLGSALESDAEAFAVRLFLCGQDTRVRVPFAAVARVLDEKAELMWLLPAGPEQPGPTALKEDKGSAGEGGTVVKWRPRT